MTQLRRHVMLVGESLLKQEIPNPLSVRTLDLNPRCSVTTKFWD